MNSYELKKTTKRSTNTPSSTAANSQLYFTDYYEHKFTLPPEPIQCRSEIISRAASQNKSLNQIISDEQVEWWNDHIFKSKQSN